MKFASVAVALVLLFGFTNLALAQNRPRGGTVAVPNSSIEKPNDVGLRAHTNVRVFVPAGGMPKSEAESLSGPPFRGYYIETPASLACIYNLVPQTARCNPNVVTSVSSGGINAIAIVDAYDDPGAAKDLKKFSTQFGLPAADFHVVFATGVRPFNDSGWEIEESLDIEYAHAMAPYARLYLVEAASNSFNDLLAAEAVAGSLVAQAGGGVVSNSWGGSEFPSESAYDSFFSYPGVVYVASTGDGPGTLYPSTSPNVVAVGGTTISRNPVTGAYEYESVWNSTGGGPSQYEPVPPYQKSIAKIGGTRGVPDISSDADPNSGVWVWDSGNGGWYFVGGTSLSAPTVAGIINAAGSNYSSSAAELAIIYKNRGNPADFRDITSGVCGPWNGNLGTRGWDFCTGVGSPVGFGGK